MNPEANAATSTPAQEDSEGTVLKPPVARREPVEHVLHGDRRVDHYAWLRHKENPEVIAYLEAENSYTDAILKPTEAFQEKLYQEMLGRIQQTDLSVPYRLRGYLYFTRTRSEEHTSELQSPCNLVCRLLLEKKKKKLTRFQCYLKH